MKGYKMFDADWKCQGMQYEVGKTYEMDGTLTMCERGFHFCEKLEDCFNYYEAVTWNHIAEVEALGKIITEGDKSCTNKIKIIREVELNGVNRSYGVNRSNGVNRSDGVNMSDGVNRSNGVNMSYGVLNSFGVDGAIFLANKKRRFSIFGKKVSQKRYGEVWSCLPDKLHGWTPTFNNLKSLYLKYGSEWKKTPIDRAEEISKEEAWASMPQEAIEYIKSLPEYDADMFYEITGLR